MECNPAARKQGVAPYSSDAPSRDAWHHETLRVWELDPCRGDCEIGVEANLVHGHGPPEESEDGDSDRELQYKGNIRTTPRSDMMRRSLLVLGSVIGRVTLQCLALSRRFRGEYSRALGQRGS